MRAFFCTANSGKIKEFQEFFRTQAPPTRGGGPSPTFSSVQSFQDVSLPDTFQAQGLTPVENSDSFLCNALVKLLFAYFVVRGQKIDCIVADDSGLCVPALHYKPGVHSAFFAGVPRSDDNNNALLQKTIADCPAAVNWGAEKRLPAFFVCFLLSLECAPDAQELPYAADHFQAQKVFESNPQGFLAQEKELLDRVDLTQPGLGAHFALPLKNLYTRALDGLTLHIDYGCCCGFVSTQPQRLVEGAGHGYDPLFYPLSKPQVSFASMTTEEKNNYSHRAFALASFARHIFCGKGIFL